MENDDQPKKESRAPEIIPEKKEEASPPNEVLEEENFTNNANNIAQPIPEEDPQEKLQSDEISTPFEYPDAIKEKTDEDLFGKIQDESKSLEPLIPNWEVISMLSLPNFSQPNTQTSHLISENDRFIHPIIFCMFQNILQKCENGFNFETERLPFEDYLLFYREINRLRPKLTKKITVDDCKGPVFFIGDSHGSIEDSYLVIKFLINVFLKDSTAKVVFVGDYVDRNPYGLQNLTLILAFYFLYPGRIVLLRGNHEDRTINQYYGFLDDLLRRFYEKAEELYEYIIEFFIKLPIAHISQMFTQDSQLGARVFSVHGGIPIDVRNFAQPILIDSLEDILVCEVDKSDEMDNLTVSMLWGDPDEMIQQIVTDNQGSGRMRFGVSVFNQFMAANKLDVVVRGHQKWKDGYKIFFNHRLYSIFSTSKYDDRKKFDPKILQLSIGKPPNIIPIDEIRFAEELKKFI